MAQNYSLTGIWPVSCNKQGVGFAQGPVSYPRVPLMGSKVGGMAGIINKGDVSPNYHSTNQPLNQSTNQPINQPPI